MRCNAIILEETVTGRLTAMRIWLSSKDRVGNSVDSNTKSSELKSRVGRPCSEADSDTGDNIGNDITIEV